MEIKYIVKSEVKQNLYLQANVDLGIRIAAYAFSPCRQIIHEAAYFNSKAEALAACEEAAKYTNLPNYVPVILEVVVS